MVHVPDALVARVLDARKRHAHLPSQVLPLSRAFADEVLGVLFPHFASSITCSVDVVTEDIIQLAENLARLERAVSSHDHAMPSDLVNRFLEGLPELHDALVEDARAIFEGDPAAKSLDEVVLTYPGFLAIAVFRIAHTLHALGLPLLPRLLTEYAHQRTGVDLHPGATIGRRFCIDHGTGIVVGETTRIGDGVKLYQGVTLGALTVEKAQADKKRHPTIEDHVVIYAGATILGGATTVGFNSIIGGNAFLTQSVPPNSIVTRQNEVRSRHGLSQEDIEFVI